MTASPPHSPHLPPLADLELEHGDRFGPYLLQRRTEILFVLRALLRQKALVTVYYDAAGHFFLSSVLAVDDAAGRLILDPGNSAGANDQALSTQKLIVAARQDRVKVQFYLSRLEAVNHEGKPALAAPLPASLLRLQRREYFRLDTPLAPTLTCRLELPRPEVAPLTEVLRILDISGGGACLALPESLAPLLPPGTHTGRCRIELPEAGVVAADLVVRSLAPHTAESGLAHVRLGCEFVELSRAQRALVERFVTRLERQGFRTREPGPQP